MSMDSDEFYLEDQLKHAKEEIISKGYEGIACRFFSYKYFNFVRMRTFFKEPTCELLPPDSMNAVPVIYVIKEGCEFKLAVNYHEKHNILLDPTRFRSIFIYLF